MPRSYAYHFISTLYFSIGYDILPIMQQNRTSG